MFIFIYLGRHTVMSRTYSQLSYQKSLLIRHSRSHGILDTELRLTVYKSSPFSTAELPLHTSQPHYKIWYFFQLPFYMLLGKKDNFLNLFPSSLQPTSLSHNAATYICLGKGGRGELSIIFFEVKDILYVHNFGEAHKLFSDSVLSFF